MKKGNHKRNQTLDLNRQGLSKVSDGSGKLGPAILIEDIQAFIDRTLQEKQSRPKKKRPTSLQNSLQKKSRKK